MGFVGGAVVGLLFPGQGSQFVGMGRDTCAEFPEAKLAFEEADDVLGFGLSRLCFEGPESDLTLTHNAQPAILAHSIATWRCVGSRLGDIALAAGHSLGEFSAWVAADAMTYADGLRTVRRRGELMLRSGESRAGTMAAVLGLEDDAIRRLCAEASSAEELCVPANYNSPGQTVISGDVAAVERAMLLAKAAGSRRVIRLSVSGAFHSPLMKVAEAGLREQLASVPFRAARFPVISNVRAAAVSDPEQARALLVEQLTSAVRWTDGIRAMISAGVRRFVELGPGAVLTGLLKRIERDVEGIAVGSAAEIRALA
jgi:[acyl-carrier-protein] S-malonyltransferase